MEIQVQVPQIDDIILEISLDPKHPDDAAGYNTFFISPTIPIESGSVLHFYAVQIPSIPEIYMGDKVKACICEVGVEPIRPEIYINITYPVKLDATIKAISH